MPKLNRTLAAFTILEMLINVAVMAIIVSLVYYTYGAFTQQVFNYQNIAIEEQAFQQFYTQLKGDCYQSEKIIKEDAELQFFFYDGSAVSYRIAEAHLVRTQLTRKDSLPMRAIKLDFVPLKKNPSTLVQQITLKTTLFEEALQLHFYKKYPPNLTIEM